MMCTIGEGGIQSKLKLHFESCSLSITSYTQHGTLPTALPQKMCQLLLNPKH